jgi:hypothetical protein
LRRLIAAEEGVARGHVRFRLIDATYFLESDEWDDFAEYERKVNGCFRNQRLIALCSYRTRR